MYAICLPRENRSCFCARCSSTLTLIRKCDCVLRSFFKADAIIASSISKSRKSFTTIDRDVISSSIDFAISTSLIQSKVIWRSAALRQTSVDFPALKFQRVRKFSKTPSRNRNSPIIHHTIVRISSTNVVQHTTSSLEVRWRNWRLQRFSFHFTISFSWRVDSIRSEFLWGWCQILWIAEDNPSWARGRSKTFPVIPLPFCVSRDNPESQRGKVLGLRLVEVWSGTWIAPELLPGSRSRSSLASDKELIHSVL